MKSIKKQVIEAYDKHYVSSCAEVVDLTLEKVGKKIDKIVKKSGTTHWCEDKTCKCYNPKMEDQNCFVIKKLDIKELKLSLKGGKTK